MISTRGRYALRVMIDLAAQDPKSFIPLGEIAERQGISIKYLEIIIKTLVKHGLLNARRGKSGGYQLTRPPEAYPIGEILELTEGPMATVACLMPGAAECPRNARCQTLPMWRRFDAMVHDFFYSMSLKDLMDEGQPS